MIFSAKFSFLLIDSIIAYISELSLFLKVTISETASLLSPQRYSGVV